MQINDLLTKLKNVRKTSNGWDARCPVHEDDKASLGISQGREGHILLKCRAGCATERVVEALGLTMSDLMPGPKTRDNGGSTYQRWTIRAASSGKPAAVHVRCDRPGQDKEVWWTDLDGNPGLKGIKTADLALYGADQLGDLEDVVVCEGEKATDALLDKGIAAVGTVTGASGMPCDDALRPLLGRQVILWLDNDQSGIEHMRRIGARLLELGLPEENLKVVSWGTSKGDDAADAASQGEDLATIVADAVPWQNWVVAFADETSNDRHNSRHTNSLKSKEISSKKRVLSVSSASAVCTTSKRVIPPWVPFPVEAFPEPAQSYIREGAAAMGCDDAMITLPVLVMLGASIGLSRRLRLKDSWLVPPTIWGGVNAESGTLKSPAQEYGLRPIMAVQHEAMIRYKKELADFKAEMNEWKSRKKSERGLEPVEPVATRYVCSDVTTEGLAPILERNSRGVLVAVDELAGWIGSFDQYRSRGKGADGPRWLSLHRAGELIIDRKTSPTVYIPRTTASVIGGIQPSIACQVLSGEALDSGLVARLLLVAPPTRPKRWTDEDISSEISKAMGRRVRQLTKLEPIVVENSVWPKDLPLSPDAREFWKEWYNRHAERLSNAEGPLASAFAKLEEYAARFALIIELVGSPAPGQVDNVGAEALHVGTRIADWFVYEVERIYQMWSESPKEEEDRKLIEWIAHRAEGVTRRDIVRSRSKYNGKGGTERAAADLQDLIDAGQIVAEERPSGQSGGRRTVVYRVATRNAENIVDSTDTDETPQGHQPDQSDNYPNKIEIEGIRDTSLAEVSSAQVAQAKINFCPAPEPLKPI